MFHQKLILKKGSGECLPVDDDSFDVVIAFECIEHMESPYTFILEAKRVLKPSGYLICSVPFGINDIFAEILHGSCNTYHLHRFTPQTMRHLLSNCFAIQKELGQKLISIDHYTYILLNYTTWKYLKLIPLIGKLLLNLKIKERIVSPSLSQVPTLIIK